MIINNDYYNIIISLYTIHTLHIVHTLTHTHTPYIIIPKKGGTAMSKSILCSGNLLGAFPYHTSSINSDPNLDGN